MSAPRTEPSCPSADAALRRLLAAPAAAGSLVDEARRLRSGELSPLEALRQRLRRIEAVDPQLNCFVTVDPEQAERQAARLVPVEPRSERPPLWGVPVSVKDLTPTAGLRTTFSSRAFGDHTPAHDGPVVTVMRAAGMVIVGKTNTSEFGLLPVTESELNGVCRNPWSPQLSAGGSSGGAAASVAAGLTAVAHGSDGAGSLRIPASCCGVVAVMPGPGRLPASTRVTMAGGAHDGVVSRSVADAVLCLAGWRALSPDEVVRAVPTDPWPPVDGTVSLVCSPPLDCAVDGDCQRAARLAADLLAGTGHRVRERSLDWSGEAVLDDLLLLRASIPIAYGDPPQDQLDATTRRYWRLAEGRSAIDVHRALARLHAYATRVASLVADDEVLLTPTLARPSVPHGWLRQPEDPAVAFRRAATFAPFTAIANILGLCAVSVPVLWTDASVPVGVQLASGPQNLATLLGLAARLEQLNPWLDRTPPVPGA